MLYEEVQGRSDKFAEHLSLIKSERNDIPWYPYSTFGNLHHLKPLVTPEIEQLFSGGRKFADIGAADGDLAFFLESLGNSCDIYDFGPTNYNTLRGARVLKDILKSSVNIFEIDLDSQFNVSPNYDLIFFLGIFYHLKNPFFALEKLGAASRYLVLSTRIVRHFAESSPDVSNFASAYLCDTYETNNDPTNFWLFTETGLRRIIERAGWDIISFRSVGDTERSNPQDPNRDERAFCFLQSRKF